jgi:hypothetical protein
MFICNKESKEKQDLTCPNCSLVVPVKLYRVSVEEPWCPFCDFKIDHTVFEQLYSVEDTQKEYDNNSSFNEFEGLEYALNSGN